MVIEVGVVRDGGGGGGGGREGGEAESKSPAADDVMSDAASEGWYRGRPTENSANTLSRRTDVESRPANKTNQL